MSLNPNPVHTVNGVADVVGEQYTQLTVREDWGPRVVVRGDDGKEMVLWGKDLLQCKTNPHSLKDPYTSMAHHKWNRIELRPLKPGLLVQHQRSVSCVPPAGCAESKEDDLDPWTKAIVLRVIRSGSTRHVVYSVATPRCIHDDSVRLTRRMLQRARRDNRLWGSGFKAPARCTERHVVSAKSYDHLRDWVFNTDFLEPLKATEQATQRGHCFAVREAAAATFERYQKDAALKKVDPVGERVYRRVIGQKVFTKYRKDHCMCSTCLRSGWRGIWDKGRKLIKLIDAHPNWVFTTGADGEKVRHVPGGHLTTRLKRIWDFLRLQLHLHVETTSDIGAHCLNFQLGSLAEPRYNNACEHHDFASPPLDDPSCTRECCADDCSKRSKHHCNHCPTSFCKACLAQNICTSENLPHDAPASFICKQCSPRVESCSHKAGGCATCDEVDYFKKDLMKAAKATGSEDILGRAIGVCKSIDIMVGHTQRTANQVLHTRTHAHTHTHTHTHTYMLHTHTLICTRTHTHLSGAILA